MFGRLGGGGPGLVTVEEESAACDMAATARRHTSFFIASLRRPDAAGLQLSGFTDPDGVGPGLVVHRDESRAFLRVLVQNQRPERRFIVRRKAFVVFEHAIDLHLDAAVETVADI